GTVMRGRGLGFVISFVEGRGPGWCRLLTEKCKVTRIDLLVDRPLRRATNRRINSFMVEQGTGRAAGGSRSRLKSAMLGRDRSGSRATQARNRRPVRPRS